MNDRVSIIDALEESNNLDDLVLAILLRYKSDPDFEQQIIYEMYHVYYNSINQGHRTNGIRFRKLSFTIHMYYCKITICNDFWFSFGEIQFPFEFPDTKCNPVDSLIYEVCSYFRMKLKEMGNE